jgi:hypothetical protein
MIRLREILDPDLRLRIRDAIARRRGMSPAAVPEWFEMDDADFVDLLNDIGMEVSLMIWTRSIGPTIRAL